MAHDEVAAAVRWCSATATVLTMDDAHSVLTGADVLVVGDRIAAVGPRARRARRGTRRSTPRGGIVMPGMIDTHRHMWQTAMRGYGADWTLTQYFVWYYLEWGKALPPARTSTPATCSARSRRSTPASPRPSTGRTACRPSSTPTPRSTRSRRSPAASCWPTATSSRARGSGRPSPEFRDFVRRRIAGGDLLGFQLAFDVTGDPAFPEKAAFEVARELGVPGHHARRRLGRDERRRHPADARERLHDAEPASTCTPRRCQRRLLPPDRRHRRLASRSPPRASRAPGQGYPPTWQLRKHGIPVSLSMDTSVWWSGDLFSAMRTTLGADRVARAPGGARRRARPSPTTRCAPSRSSTGRPAAAPKALGLRPTCRQPRGRARRPTSCCIKNDALAGDRSRCSTRTATWCSRPSAATCTPCSSTAGWSSTSGRLVGRRPGDGRARSAADRRAPARDAGRRRLGDGHEPRRSPDDARCSTTRTSTRSSAPTRTRARGTVFGEPGAGEDD